MRSHVVLWIVSVAQLMVVLDVSVINVALPSMQGDLALSTQETSWVALGYTVAFAGALLTFARLADRYGPARVLAYSLTVFTLASVLGGLATDGWMLIAARILQGLAAAAVSPATFTLLLVTFTGDAPRTRAIAIWTAVSVAGGGVGNVLGGFLTDFISWRAVLLVNVPIGLVVGIGAALLVADERPRTSGAADWTTGAVSIGTVGLLILGLTRVADSASVSSESAAFLITAAALAIWWWRRNRTSPDPVIPQRLWRLPGVGAGALATFLTAMCFQIALWYFLTFLLQRDRGLDPLETGIAFLPLTLSLLVVNLVAVPRLMHLVRPRTLITVGACLAAAGLLWIGMGGAFWIAVVAPSVLIGVGGGLVNTPLAMSMTRAVPEDESGAASGIMNSAKQIGGAVGLAVAIGAQTVTADPRAPFVVMACALAAAAAISRSVG